MSDSAIEGLSLNTEELRASIRQEYAAVASEPERGFHFHTGRKLAQILGYPDEWIDGLPAGAVESMAGSGRLQVADIALQKPVPDDARGDVSLWTGCIAGGLLKAALEQKVKDAGFKDVEVLWGEDVFSGAAQHSDAAEFGTLGVLIRARKAHRARSGAQQSAR